MIYLIVYKMEDLHPKFIIEGDRLVLGKVEYHEDLADNKYNVKGGGWFYYDREKDLFILYGKSIQFGPAKIEDIINAVKNGFVDSPSLKEIYNNEKFAYHWKAENLVEAIENYIVIEK